MSDDDDSSIDDDHSTLTEYDYCVVLAKTMAKQLTQSFGSDKLELMEDDVNVVEGRVAAIFDGILYAKQAIFPNTSKVVRPEHVLRAAYHHGDTLYTLADFIVRCNREWPLEDMEPMLTSRLCTVLSLTLIDYTDNSDQDGAAPKAKKVKKTQ